MVDFVPNKNMGSFIHQVILAITKILIKNMNEVNSQK